MNRRNFLSTIAISGLFSSLRCLAQQARPTAPGTPVDTGPTLNKWLSLRYGRKVSPQDAKDLLGWVPPRGEILLIKPLRLGSAQKAADIPSDRLLIGTGYNSATGEKGGAVVAFNPARAAQELAMAAGDEPGQRVTFHLHQISQTQQLKDALGVSAAVSFGFGIFSSDASYSFIKTGSFSSYSSYLMVDVRVRNAAEVLRHARLTQPAMQYIRAGGVRFREFAGDQYVYGRITGGQFTAIVAFQSKSSAEQVDVQREVSAAVAGFGGGEAQFSSALQRLESISNTEVFLIRDGGIEAVPDIAGLRAAALAFPQIVARRRNPALVALLTDSYASVENLPNNFPSLEDVRRQSETLGVIAPLLDRCYRYRADLLYADLHRDEFVPFERADFDAAWDINEGNITALIGTAARVKADPQTPAPRPPEQPTFRPERRSSAPPPPPPSTTPEFKKIYPWDRTFIGRVPNGGIGIVTLRGAWMPVVLPPREVCVNNPAIPMIPVHEVRPYFPGPAHVQIIADDGSRVLRDVPYQGQPITIADGACQVYVYLPGWTDTVPWPGRIRRPECSTAEAMLTVR